MRLIRTAAYKLKFYHTSSKLQNSVWIIPNVYDEMYVSGIDADVQYMQWRWPVTESPSRGNVRRPDQSINIVIQRRPVHLVAVSNLVRAGSPARGHHHAVVRQEASVPGWPCGRLQVGETTADGAGEVRWLRSDVDAAAVLQSQLRVRHFCTAVFMNGQGRHLPKGLRVRGLGQGQLSLSSPCKVVGAPHIRTFRDHFCCF